MAVVYEARRESIAGVAPRVAIKLILPEHAQSLTFRELFINEARLGAAMQHQNLVQIQAFEEEGDQYFLVMEYVEGLTIRRVISLCARHDIEIPLRVVAEIGRQACEGLHYAHKACDDHKRPLELVHRDIKPSNLILNPHGVVKVLDFGISKGILRPERRGSVKGTWGYMAPEQAFGKEVGPRADVFGLAVVLYELAARQPMFRDKDHDEIKRLLSDDHAARMCATLDPAYRDLIGVLVRGLQRGQGARYPSAEAFGRALSSLLPDPITARDETVRFFEHVHALYEGKRVGTLPPSQPAVSQGSMSAGLATEEPDTFALWIAAGVFSSFLAVTILLGGVLLAMSQAGVPPFSAPSADAPIVVPASSRGPEPVREVPDGAAESEVPASTPVRVKVVRPAPRPAPAPAPEPHVSAPTPAPPEPAPSPVEVAEPAVLMIGAIQHGSEVYLDGRFVRQVPVRKELPAGSYVVSIVSPDGRRKSFRVELTSGKTARKVWDFDRGDWR